MLHLVYEQTHTDRYQCLCIRQHLSLEMMKSTQCGTDTNLGSVATW